MITEEDALSLWQQLFRGQPTTTLTFHEAGSVIDSLPIDSPVRSRLAEELEQRRRLMEATQ